MIKPPVKRCIVSDNIVDYQGNWIAKLYDLGADADEVVKRINMHDELVAALQDVEDFTDWFYTKELIGTIPPKPLNEIAKNISELLERCK